MINHLDDYHNLDLVNAQDAEEGRDLPPNLVLPPMGGSQANRATAGGNQGSISNRLTTRNPEESEILVPPILLERRFYSAEHIFVKLHMDSTLMGQYVVGTNEQLASHGHVLDGLVAAIARYNFSIISTFRRWKPSFRGLDQEMMTFLRKSLLSREGEDDDCYITVSLLIGMFFIRYLRSAVKSWLEHDPSMISGGVSLDIMNHARACGSRLQRWLEGERVLLLNQNEVSAIQYAKTISDRVKPTIRSRLMHYCLNLNFIIESSRTINNEIHSEANGTQASEIDNPDNQDMTGLSTTMIELSMRGRHGLNCSLHGLGTCILDLVSGRPATIPIH